MTQQHADAKKVVIAVRMAGVPGRRKLAGVFRWLDEHDEHWDIRFVRTQEYFTPKFVRSLSSAGIDGVIASFPDAREANVELERSGIPAVILDPREVSRFPARRRSLAWLQSDAAAIGRVAAEHLKVQGRFRSYGYVHDRARSVWSEGRAAAFAEATGGCVEFNARNFGPDRDIAAIAKWLGTLPRPAGVMVAFDDRAITVMEACRLAGLAVPGDVAIVSCDNDELICNHQSPGITSVEADFAGIGSRAAELLSKMMRRRQGGCDAVLETCSGVRLVARGSSAPVSSGGPLVMRALAFIDENAVRGIGVQDVVSHLNVSRRLADMRFREVRGMSISESIRARKIEAVKNALARTDDKIDIVAAQCGFSDPKYMMTMFRQVVGCSMGEWRRRAKREVWS